MRNVKACMVVALLAFLMLPCLAYGQTDPLPPPPCCNQNDPTPPPPLGGNSLVLGGGALGTMAQISISDATLASMGLSRSQALELLAGALFPNAGQAVNLIIPVVNPGTTLPVSAQDPSVINYQFETAQVPEGLMNGLTWLYITDGHTYVLVVFTQDSTAPGH
jgi:hypothetical protein